MDSSVSNIPLLNLSIILLPMCIVIFVQYKWSLSYKDSIQSVIRMLIQLLLVGYVLTYIFNAESSWVIILTLIVMLMASSWISLRLVKEQRWKLLAYSLLSIIIGGGGTLLIVTQGVLKLTPWFHPQYMIPLAGMVFANSMNSISLATDRLFSELENDIPFVQARIVALKTALIPVVNSMFAVGLVSLPGMMTGQILAGVSPFIAARYQIMVMGMIFSAAGLSAICFLYLAGSLRGPSEAIGNRRNYI